MSTPNEIMARFKARHAIPKKPRKNWKRELSDERNKVIDEAKAKIKNQMRNVPKEWHRGYYSAITQLEIMKDEPNNDY